MKFLAFVFVILYQVHGLRELWKGHEFQDVNKTYETIFVDFGTNVELALLTSNDYKHALIPDYSEFYYYRFIEEKMIESMSVNNCTLHGAPLLARHEMTSHILREPNSADIFVQEIKPPKFVTDLWGSDGRKVLERGDIYVGISPNLCNSKSFLGIKKGHYRRAKGCWSMIDTKNGTSFKKYNDYGATLHPDHIRCKIAEASSFCAHGSKGVVSKIPANRRSLNSIPFIVKAYNVMVARSGMIGLPCGPFGLFSSCEAVKWGIPSAVSTIPDAILCRKDLSKCPYPVVDKIFIMSQYDDTQIGQFMMESFPRLVYNLEYLEQNPDIKIHFGFTKQPTVPNFVLPNIYINWLGLGDRLINGTFFAKEVIMSREGGCQDAGYNAWEVITMREKFIRKLHLLPDNVPFPGKPRIVLLSRSSSSAYTQNKSDGKSRSWPRGTLEILIDLISKSFPNHQFLHFSDKNTTLMSCPACQIEAFREADIAIGMHGAGLTNTMYMRPGSVVIEVVPRFDSRHTPVIGIFPRLSSIVGLHHYTYFIKENTEFSPLDLIDKTQKFYQKAMLWTHSSKII